VLLNVSESEFMNFTNNETTEIINETTTTETIYLTTTTENINAIEEEASSTPPTTTESEEYEGEYLKSILECNNTCLSFARVL